MKYWKSPAAVIVCVLSGNVNAEIISADWQTAGDNLVTRDTVSGLEWLDLTTTRYQSYDYVNARLGIGQEFDGWRYATSTELSELWDAFGGNSAFYNDYSAENDGLFDIISSYMGDLRAVDTGVMDPGTGYSFMIIADEPTPGSHWVALMDDNIFDPNTASADGFFLQSSIVPDYGGSPYGGSALVRSISTVPLPSAVWLLGSGLLSLFGVVRKKRT